MNSRKWKKRIRAAQKGKEIEQVAALPYRFENGQLQILLITSRTTRRFTLPKGWPMKKRQLHEAAQIEAQEEAGITGEIASTPIGEYFYWKRLKDVFIPIKVQVYPLLVDSELQDWQERSERHRKWLAPKEVGLLVDEPELVSLIDTLDDKIRA